MHSSGKMLLALHQNGMLRLWNLMTARCQYKKNMSIIPTDDKDEDDILEGDQLDEEENEDEVDEDDEEKKIEVKEIKEKDLTPF